MFNSDTGETDFACPTNDTNPGDCTLKPKYADSKILVQLLTASAEPGAEFEFQKTVSLNDLYQSILRRIVVPVDVPLTGFPDLYPQDNYFFDVLMSFNLPDNIERLVNGKTPTGPNADPLYLRSGTSVRA